MFKNSYTAVFYILGLGFTDISWRFTVFECVFVHFCVNKHVPSPSPFLSDPAGTLCLPALSRPRGSAKKPQCEINPFLPHPSDLKWVAPLTESTLSPIYLGADWFTTSHQDVKQQLTIASITRAPTASKDHNGNNS